MHYAQIFTYHIDLPSKAEHLTDFVDPYAEHISRINWLKSKVWMADFDNRFASFYLWENKEAMDAFMQSGISKGLGQIPFVKNLSIVDYPVVKQATRITKGIWVLRIEYFF